MPATVILPSIIHRSTMSSRDRRSNRKSNSTFLSIVGLLTFALIFVAVYLQWNSFLTQHENDRLAKSLTASNRRIDTYQNVQRSLSFQYQRLLTLLRSPRLRIVHIPGNPIDFRQATLIWDQRTLRSALIFDDLIIPADSQLTIWGRLNPRDAWQLSGSIRAFKPDTVYTQLFGPALNKVEELELVMSPNSDTGSPRPGRRIARRRLPP